jgi:hypothetical protein
MGGLAGIPFTGRTGFTAFSHHIPDGAYPVDTFALPMPAFAAFTKEITLSSVLL